MMKRRKLVNVQWRVIQYTVGAAVLATAVALVVAGYMENVELGRLLFHRVWGIPSGAFLLVVVLAVGAAFGYVFGKSLKKRLEELVAAILRFERGNYAYRVPDLGDDEIGQAALHLNAMAEHIENQVASLQKLSSEKAKWNEELKHAAIAEERQRLARELHDAVSQQLFAISMLSSAVRETHRVDPEATPKQLAIIEEMAGHAQNEMRALLLHLRPARLDGKGLKQGVEELLAEFQAKQPINIKWKIDDVAGMPKGVEDHLFRIVQEGLSNVLRHSKAKTLNVRLIRSEKQIHLKITDDGIGFDVNAQKASSYGLKSIRERVSEIGGVVEIFSMPGKGTEIDVKVPVIKEAKEPHD